MVVVGISARLVREFSTQVRGGENQISDIIAMSAVLVANLSGMPIVIFASVAKGYTQSVEARKTYKQNLRTGRSAANT